VLNSLSRERDGALDWRADHYANLKSSELEPESWQDLRPQL